MRHFVLPDAGVAQLVEQLIRNEKVGGSTPLSGTKKPREINKLRSRLVRLFAFRGCATVCQLCQEAVRVGSGSCVRCVICGYSPILATDRASAEIDVQRFTPCSEASSS